jgi:hypothetical protein
VLGLERAEEPLDRRRLADQRELPMRVREIAKRELAERREPPLGCCRDAVERERRLDPFRNSRPPASRSFSASSEPGARC